MATERFTRKPVWQRREVLRASTVLLGALAAGVPVAATAASPYDADATASSEAGIKAILNDWARNWNGTVPAGKSTSDPRVVQLTANVPSLSFAKYKFPKTVLVRGSGPYGYSRGFPHNPTCGSHVGGAISLSGCRNLGIALITCEHYGAAGCSGLVFDRVSAHSRWSRRLSSPPSGKNPDIISCPGAIFRRSHFAGFDAYCLGLVKGSAGTLIEDCYFEQSRNDYMKVKSPGDYTGMVIRRNVFGRAILSAKGAHTDVFQAQAGDVSGLLWWGNLAISGPGLNNTGVQFLWLSNKNKGSNVHATQNISATRAKNALRAPPSGRGNSCTYNTALYAELRAHGAVQNAKSANAPGVTGKWSTVAYNFACKLNPGSPETAGRGGVTFHVGNLRSGKAVANTAAMAKYFNGYPADNAFIDQIRPRDGTPAHWDYGGQKIGAWQRSKEIWADRYIHSNLGWPVAGPFIREYDPRNTIGTSWTGRHDANGLNG